MAAQCSKPSNSCFNEAPIPVKIDESQFHFFPFFARRPTNFAKEVFCRPSTNFSSGLFVPPNADSRYPESRGWPLSLQLSSDEPTDADLKLSSSNFGVRILPIATCNRAKLEVRLFDAKP